MACRSSAQRCRGPRRSRSWPRRPRVASERNNRSRPYTARDCFGRSPAPDRNTQKMPLRPGGHSPKARRLMASIGLISVDPASSAAHFFGRGRVTPAFRRCQSAREMIVAVAAEFSVFSLQRGARRATISPGAAMASMTMTKKKVSSTAHLPHLLKDDAIGFAEHL